MNSLRRLAGLLWFLSRPVLGGISTFPVFVGNATSFGMPNLAMQGSRNESRSVHSVHSSRSSSRSSSSSSSLGLVSLWPASPWREVVCCAGHNTTHQRSVWLNCGGCCCCCMRGLICDLGLATSWKRLILVDIELRRLLLHSWSDLWPRLGYIMETSYISWYWTAEAAAACVVWFVTSATLHMETSQQMGEIRLSSPRGFSERCTRAHV